MTLYFTILLGDTKMSNAQAEFYFGFFIGFWIVVLLGVFLDRRKKTDSKTKK